MRESRKCVDDITFSAMNQLKGKIRITSLLKTLGVLVIFIYHNTTIIYMQRNIVCNLYYNVYIFWDISITLFYCIGKQKSENKTHQVSFQPICQNNYHSERSASYGFLNSQQKVLCLDIRTYSRCIRFSILAVIIKKYVGISRLTDHISIRYIGRKNRNNEYFDQIRIILWFCGK